VADGSDQLIFHGDWNEKSHFPTGTVPNVNHALLVVGARLTGSDKMGGIKLLVQNLSQKKPFVTIGYDLLLSMGVYQLLDVQPGLNFSTDNNSVDHAGGMIQSGSPRSQAFSWGLDKPVETPISEEDGAARTSGMPNYWMKINPKEIAYILT
jgi:hypothetical protein